jgi:pilus assembly protein CpaC
MKIFGFKWSPLMGGGGGVIKYGRSKAGDIYTDSNGTLAGTLSNLFPKLASAKAAGYARVIQSGMIIVKEGQSGNIKKSTSTKSSVSAGGKFSTSTSTSASFDLTAKPTLISKNKEVITLNIGVNVVMSDGGASSTNNTLKSEVDVRSGQTAVMGGIAIKKTSTSYDRDPPYGQIDYKSAGPGGTPAVPIFSFLKSKKYLNDRNQFVVFATPSIIETASENVEAIKSKFLKRGR